MKKTLIALSVAAGLASVAQANTTTLYGSLGVETVYDHTNGSDEDNKWDLTTQTAKIGVKGTEDLSNGLQAFYKFEFDFTGSNDDANSGLNSTRYALIGLTGDFGTLTFGKQDSLYKIVTKYNDIFENNYWADGTTTFEALTGGSRIPKVISYVSPDFGGFVFAIAGVLDGSNNIVSNEWSESEYSYDTTNNELTIAQESGNLSTRGDGFVAYQLGVMYNANGFYAGLAYSNLKLSFVDNTTSTVVNTNTGAVTVTSASDNDDFTAKVTGLAVGYSNDQFKVGFGAQHASSQGEIYNLAGEIYSGQNTFRAGFALADFDEDSIYVGDNEAGKKVYTYALGYQYNFSNRTYTYVEGQYHDRKNEANDYQIRVGLRHNF